MNHTKRLSLKASKMLNGLRSCPFTLDWGSVWDPPCLHALKQTLDNTFLFGLTQTPKELVTIFQKSGMFNLIRGRLTTSYKNDPDSILALLKRFLKPRVSSTPLINAVLDALLNTPETSPHFSSMEAFYQVLMAHPDIKANSSFHFFSENDKQSLQSFLVELKLINLNFDASFDINTSIVDTQRESLSARFVDHFFKLDYTNLCTILLNLSAPLDRRSHIQALIHETLQPFAKTQRTEVIIERLIDANMLNVDDLKLEKPYQHAQKDSSSFKALLTILLDNLDNHDKAAMAVYNTLHRLRDDLVPMLGMMPWPFQTTLHIPDIETQNEATLQCHRWGLDTGLFGPSFIKRKALETIQIHTPNLSLNEQHDISDSLLKTLLDKEAINLKTFCLNSDITYTEIIISCIKGYRIEAPDRLVESLSYCLASLEKLQLKSVKTAVVFSFLTAFELKSNANLTPEMLTGETALEKTESIIRELGCPLSAKRLVENSLSVLWIFAADDSTERARDEEEIRRMTQNMKHALDGTPQTSDADPDSGLCRPIYDFMSQYAKRFDSINDSASGALSMDALQTEIIGYLDAILWEYKKSTSFDSFEYFRTHTSGVRIFIIVSLLSMEWLPKKQTMNSIYAKKLNDACNDSLCLNNAAFSAWIERWSPNWMNNHLARIQADKKCSRLEAISELFRRMSDSNNTFINTLEEWYASCETPDDKMEVLRLAAAKLYWNNGGANAQLSVPRYSSPTRRHVELDTLRKYPDLPVHLADHNNRDYVRKSMLLRNRLERISSGHHVPTAHEMAKYQASIKILLAQEAEQSWYLEGPPPSLSEAHDRDRLFALAQRYLVCGIPLDPTQPLALTCPHRSIEISYIGEWEGDKFQGPGTFCHSTGRKQGVWLDGDLSGDHSHIHDFQCKTNYLGGTLCGLRHGPGELSINRDGRSSIVRKGQWYRNELCSGTETFSSKPSEDDLPRSPSITNPFTPFPSSPRNFTYSGQWNNNRYHGEGALLYDDLFLYKGSFCAGFMHGQGTVHFAYLDPDLGLSEDKEAPYSQPFLTFATSAGRTINVGHFFHDFIYVGDWDLATNNPSGSGQLYTISQQPTLFFDGTFDHTIGGPTFGALYFHDTNTVRFQGSISSTLCFENGELNNREGSPFFNGQFHKDGRLPKDLSPFLVDDTAWPSSPAKPSYMRKGVSMGFLQNPSSPRNQFGF